MVWCPLQQHFQFPLLLSDGRPFPYRDLILFITFIVILVTLVIQGLTLPWLIRKVGLEDKYAVIPAADQEILIQKKIFKASLKLLDEKYSDVHLKNEHLKNLISRLKTDIAFFQGEIGQVRDVASNALSDYQHIYLDLLQQQRITLNDLNKDADFDEKLIRKYLSLIDLEEYKIRQKLV